MDSAGRVGWMSQVPYGDGAANDLYADRAAVAPPALPGHHVPAPGPLFPGPLQPSAGAPPVPKSPVVAAMLTTTLGPLGAFYSTVVGGASLVAVDLLATAIGQYGVVLLSWPASVIWGVWAASGRNRDGGPPAPWGGPPR